MIKTILRQLIVLPVIMGVMAMLYACGTANGRAGATANKPFNTTYVLQQGASAVITPAAAQGIAGGATAPTIKLERVNDSRCRVGAVCVWAGYISYSFTLTKADGTTSNFVLSDSMPNGKTSVTQDGLTFALAGVEPQAVPAKNEPAPDYRVSLRVSNTPPSDPTPRPS
ncbi:hypothetical protein SAMN05428959_102596 [Duganella sp. CF517]|uniref:hypothetical protein n=1 Tax=Duganella sp. CF517 TaxID=1881038 RepID=UPI0008D49451|nr:hypothetical protein [Duganella sp. CF517]SEN60887.1 hypothetical protein SAMN05428959_102596 [Duganella sp. CF517]